MTSMPRPKTKQTKFEKNNPPSFHYEEATGFMTSRAGLSTLAKLMNKLRLAELIDEKFARGQSNRAYAASDFIISMILYLHEGGDCLEDVKRIRDDAALREFVGLSVVPDSTTISKQLKRIGKCAKQMQSMIDVNRRLLRCALGKQKTVTVDIDATAILNSKMSARCTYLKERGFMPMVGTIAETSQVLFAELREGNTPPNKDNLKFLQKCEQALPKGVVAKYIRADAASYQAEILRHCIENKQKFFIRACSCKALRQAIARIPDNEWEQSLSNEGEQLSEIEWTMPGVGKPYRLIVQRQARDVGQLSLEFHDEVNFSNERKYVYRAIATNNYGMSMANAVRFYNQRGDCAENRIKDLKGDFGGGRLPCGNFAANAAYFQVCVLAHNTFSLLKIATKNISGLKACRVKRMRSWVYSVAGAVVRHARRVVMRVEKSAFELIRKITRNIDKLSFPREDESILMKPG